MITHHVPLRSNMESVLAHASNGRSRAPFTRAEIIRRLRRKENSWLERTKERMFAKPVHKRVANVRKLKDGFKVVGVKSLLDLTMPELKQSLKKRGFTDYRWSGKVLAL